MAESGDTATASAERARSVVAQHALGDRDVVDAGVLLGRPEDEPFPDEVRGVDHCSQDDERVTRGRAQKRSWTIGWL